MNIVSCKVGLETWELVGNGKIGSWAWELELGKLKVGTYNLDVSEAPARVPIKYLSPPHSIYHRRHRRLDRGDSECTAVYPEEGRKGGMFLKRSFITN